jgi:hypothetical protein
MTPYLEGIFTSVSKNKTLSHPFHHIFNVNGLSTWYSPDLKYHLVWWGNDLTGLAYKDLEDGRADVYPYYHGQVLTGMQLYRWTDLHKPKTEEAFLTFIYKQAYTLHQECKNVATVGGLEGSFEDYVMRLKLVLFWLTYFNSAVTI